MKKALSGILAAAIALSLVLSGCGTKPEATRPDPDQPPPPNEMVFMGGADFTNMTRTTVEDNEDGTYHYADLTEDGMTSVVNRCFARKDGDVDILRVLEMTGEPDIREVETWGTDDDTLAKGGLPTTYVKWVSRGNEDTQQSVGAITQSPFYTYFYYFSTGIDWYTDMDEIYQEILDRITLEEIPQP